MRFSKTLSGAAGAGVIALAMTIVPYYEGTEMKSYQDAVGVWTVCTGHTLTAGPGQTKTPEQCEALLASDLGTALSAVDRQIDADIPDTTRAALVSFTFNVGEGQLQRSTLRKLMNQGRIAEACRQLPRWVYAGGQRLRGLVKRRVDEMAMCLEGVE